MVEIASPVTASLIVGAAASPALQRRASETLQEMAAQSQDGSIFPLSQYFDASMIAGAATHDAVEPATFQTQVPELDCRITGANIDTSKIAAVLIFAPCIAIAAFRWCRNIRFSDVLMLIAILLFLAVVYTAVGCVWVCDFVRGRA